MHLICATSIGNALLPQRVLRGEKQHQQGKTFPNQRLTQWSVLRVVHECIQDKLGRDRYGQNQTAFLLL